MPPVLAQGHQQLVEVAGARDRLLRRALRSWRITGEEAARSSALAARRVAEARAARRSQPARTAAGAAVASVRPGAAWRRFTATGVACSAKRRSWTIVLLQLAQRVRGLVEPGDDVVAALGRGGARGRGVADEARRGAGAASASGAEDRVAVGGELGELLGSASRAWRAPCRSPAAPGRRGGSPPRGRGRGPRGRRRDR